MTDYQQQYTVTERALKRIIENLWEFRTILLGKKILIYTDHTNLTCKISNTNRVLRWRLIIEEYGPDIQYIKGEKNIFAYVLSRITLNGIDDTTQKSTYQQ